MGTGRSSTGSGPVALSALLDTVKQRMPHLRKEIPPGDGFVFSGNRHETVPRALLLDRRLTPLERNTWQVFRLKLNEDGITAFPAYEELRPYLASMPCKSMASHETIARALTLLRLTRWLSLVRRRRDPKTGRHLGNLYVLHDEPLTPYEAIQLDPEYFDLISQALDHASKAIQRVGLHTIEEISEDPQLKGRLLPSRLEVLTNRLTDEEKEVTEGYPQDVDNNNSEDGAKPPLRNRDTPASESEASRKPASNLALRNPKIDSTVRTYRDRREVQVPRARTRENTTLKLPGPFLELSDHQRSSALATLQQLDGDQPQAVLDEWAARCRNGGVDKPSGYLFGLIQKAIRGEFKPWASQVRPTATASSMRTSPPSSPTSPEEAKVQIANLLAQVRSLRR